MERVRIISERRKEGWIKTRDKNIDIIVVFSYKKRPKRFWQRLLIQVLYCCEVVDIYDLLEQNGLYYDSDFDDKGGLNYLDIVEDLKDYNKKYNTIEEAYYTKRLIADYLFIKDFKNADKYIKILSDRSLEGAEVYTQLMQKIDAVLESWKEEIKGSQHIILNWIDALPYTNLNNMPYVEKEIKKGIWFSNMYCVVPYTSGAMQTLFTGKLLIDDKIFLLRQEQENYKKTILYKELEKSGYDFQYIGGHFSLGIFRQEKEDWEKEFSRSLPINTPSTLYQYKLLQLLVQAKKKTFFIVHSLGETHANYMNPIDIKMVPLKYDIHPCYHGGSRQPHYEEQIKQSQLYLDEQLEYYGKYYEDVKCRIYMSDHGSNKYGTYLSIDEIYHIAFGIVGKGIMSKEISKLSSLLYFPKLMSDILQEKYCFIGEEYETDYVPIQRDDSYGSINPDFIKEHEEVCQISHFQYRGVITEEDCYICTVLGKEYYVRYCETEKNDIENPKYKNRIAYLKNINGNLYIDSFHEKKYEISKKLYAELGYKHAENIKYVENKQM